MGFGEGVGIDICWYCLVFVFVIYFLVEDSGLVWVFVWIVGNIRFFVRVWKGNSGIMLLILDNF